VITIDQGSSVTEAWEQDVTIGPNPASGSVLVGGGVELTHIYIFDNHGSLRSSVTVLGTGTRLDVSELPIGVYHLVIRSHKGQTTRSLIIER
jgi:hypothetical protein